jgi:hypothetical protein
MRIKCITVIKDIIHEGALMDERGEEQRKTLAFVTMN